MINHRINRIIKLFDEIGKLYMSDVISISDKRREKKDKDDADAPSVSMEEQEKINKAKADAQAAIRQQRNKSVLYSYRIKGTNK